jgi:hypothetical protein
LALVAVVGCGSDDPDPVSPPLVPAGTYVATTFQATPDGLGAINVLTAGGSLTVTVNANNSVNGTLTLPASVAGAPFTASMSGVVVAAGVGVSLQQSEDSFVRDLIWTVGTNTLSVTNQRAGAAVFTITLTRQ